MRLTRLGIQLTTNFGYRGYKKRVVRWPTLVALVASLGLAAPLLSAAASAQPLGSREPGLPPGLQPRLVNATSQPNFVLGEPEVAVNPKNPNNLVYVATQLAETPNCISNPANPNHANCQNVMTVFGPQPAGLITDVPGFSPNGIFVSFNRGFTWRSVTVPTLPPPCPSPSMCTDPTGFLQGGDPEITAGPNGTFYFGEDVVHFATGFGPPNPGTIAQDAGIATSVSTDGGLTWSTPVLSGTAADRPFITTDASTGTVYIESGAGPLGSGSTANPDSPNTAPAGRYLVASSDGRHWTSPEPLPAGVSGPYISAATDEFVTGGGSTITTVCGGQAACELLETTPNNGATWSHFPVPNSSDSPGGGGGPLVAADPTRPGHITVAFLNRANTSLTVLQTHDGGNTWSTPTSVAENANIHWKPWMAYGPDGTLGLMWRTWTGAANTSSYNVWAAISFDGGSTFTKPLEVSNGDSPPPNSALTFPTFADDFSNITLDRQDAFIAWADWRPGGGTQRQGFISEVKLQAFEFSDR